MTAIQISRWVEIPDGTTPVRDEVRLWYADSDGEIHEVEDVPAHTHGDVPDIPAHAE